MEIINLLGAAMGLAFVSGINLYATVLAVGFGINMGLIELAPGMEPLETLGNPLILLVAGVLYTAEFFADKVPWVDSAWDTAHTLVRPIGGAWIAASAVGTLDPALEFATILLGGGVAFTSHAIKASSRLLINQSPEPVTNVATSVFEDIVAVAGAWLAVQHPAVMFALVVLVLVATTYFGPKVLRLMRLEFAILGTLLGRLVGRRSDAWDHVPAKYRPALPDRVEASRLKLCLRAVSGKGTSLRRNLIGMLCMQDERLVFLTRSWFRPRCQELDLKNVEEAWLETRLLVHHLVLQTDRGEVRFGFFRDGSGRPARVLDLIQARVATPPRNLAEDQAATGVLRPTDAGSTA